MSQVIKLNSILFRIRTTIFKAIFIIKLANKKSLQKTKAFCFCFLLRKKL